MADNRTNNLRTYQFQNIIFLCISGSLEPLGIVVHVTKWSQPSKWWWEQRPTSTIWNVSRANNVITGKTLIDMYKRLTPLPLKPKEVKATPITVIFLLSSDFALVIVFSFMTTRFSASMIMKNAWFLLTWLTTNNSSSNLT